MAGHFERLMHVLLTPAARAFQKTLWQPSADIYRLARGWLVKFELAGIRPEELEVRVCGPRLVLRGARRDIRLEEGQQSYRMEIAYNRFERVIELPCDLEGMHLATEYRDGMLLVRFEARGTDDERLG